MLEGTYHPCPEVEPEGKPEFNLCATIIFAQDKRIGINVLPLKPTAPMPHSLPNQRRGTQADQEPKEGKNDNRRLLHVVARHVNIKKQRNKRTSTDKQRPIPLPAASNRKEALLDRQVAFTLLRERNQTKHQSEPVRNSQTNTNEAARINGVDGRVAFRGVYETTIGEHVGGQVGFVGEPAARSVGDGVVALVVGVVPVAEGGEVVLMAVECGVVFVFAGGEVAADVEEAEGVHGET